MSGILTTLGGGAFGTLVLDISNRASPDIPALLSAAGWLGVAQPVRLVNTGNVNTLVIPSSLDGASIYLFNAAGVRIGGVINGGTALRTQVPITVENLGIISGGGGRGGGGGGSFAAYDPPTWQASSGSTTGGPSGDGQGFQSATSLTIVAATDGGSGTSAQVIGSDGFGGGSVTTYLNGGSGGGGGAWGTAGGNGAPGSHYGGSPSRTADYAGIAGGLPGYAVYGNSLITWVANGTRIGRIT